MKKILLLSAYLFVCNLVYSQTKVNIEFVTETKVLLNGTEVNKSTTISTIKNILGEPEIYKEYTSGKTNYHYNDIGVSIHTLNDKLLFIGANFNWDGDTNFPETTYEGTLKIDGILFDKQSNNESINRLKNLEFITVMPGFYISKPKTKKKNTFTVIGFKDDLVTQIGFEFH